MFIVRRFNLIYTSIANLQQMGLALFAALQANTAAVEANTASNAEILSTLKSILLESAHTDKAVTYLAAVERHRQQSAGQPHVFTEVSQ